MIKFFFNKIKFTIEFKDYELAMKRVRTLLESDYDAESQKKSNSSLDVIWAVFEAFNK